MLFSLSDLALQQLIYVCGSAIVAVCIWIEGQLLRKNGGQLPKSFPFIVCSFLDTGWSIISLTVLVILDFKGMVLVMAIAYSLYSVAGWIYGTYLISKSNNPESLKRKTVPVILPLSYLNFSQSFAIAFLILCTVVLISL